MAWVSLAKVRELELKGTSTVMVLSQAFTQGTLRFVMHLTSAPLHQEDQKLVTLDPNLWYIHGNSYDLRHDLK